MNSLNSEIQKKTKCVVESIERQMFNFLKNENKEENVLFNQLNDKRSIFLTMKNKNKMWFSRNLNGKCSIVWTKKYKKKMCCSINWMEKVQLFDQRNTKRKCVVESIEWKTFNCLNNGIKQKENVVFNQLNGKCRVVWTTKKQREENKTS